MNAERSQQGLYDELSFYTLAHPDPAFIHQHIVDAFIAQTATAETKPISLAFALIGLCLYIERGASGRQVQRVHMALGNAAIDWPALPQPEQRGELSVADVLEAEPGPARDAAIGAWCAAVWAAWSGSHAAVLQLVEESEPAIRTILAT